jgi:large subunit ribosomal protein L31
MKKNLHPNWNKEAVITCACGETFTTGSSEKTLELDICSKCHPFFTGEEKFVDTQGRVEKFMKKMAAAKKKQAEKAAKEEQAKAVVEIVEESDGEEKSYQQVLADQKVSLKKEEKQEAKESKEVSA